MCIALEIVQSLVSIGSIPYEQLRSKALTEVETMFLQKFKVGLRLLGVLFLRVLLGFVAGCLWMFAVAFIFHTAVGNPPISPPIGSGHLSVFEIVDYFYEEYYDPPREWRYQGTAGRFIRSLYRLA